MGDKEQRHVEMLRGAYRTWRESKGKNPQTWLGLMGDKFVFRSLGAKVETIGFSRDGHSPEDFVRYLEDLARDWEMLTYEVERMIAEGDHVAVLAHCSWRNRRTQKISTTIKADFFRFSKGRVVEFTELFDTADAVAAATL